MKNSICRIPPGSKTRWPQRNTGEAPVPRQTQHSGLSTHSRRLLAAEVHQSRDLAAEVFAVDDEVDEAVLLEELAALEAFGQLNLDRVPDRPRAGEADQGFGLGDDEIAEHREAG